MQRPLTRYATLTVSVIALIVLAWPAAASARNAPAHQSVGVAPTSITSTAVASQADSVQRGDRGPTVGFWQDRLNTWFQLSGSTTRLVVDGIFGPRTEAATLEFQRTDNNLPNDGIVDQADRVALEDA
ncbi:MAG: peptidoglycan-binding protein, partial [Acidimicrobiia bacterium]|nr:peptidoglycan-binding protein [Acidimicrobiia bacterium]